MCRLLSGAICALLLGACSPSKPVSDESFRVALLTPGSISDGGWNQGAYEGLLLIEARLGALISHVETRTPVEFEEGFRGYAEDGFNLIFGHGFEYQEAAERVAFDFPSAVFITTSGNTVRENMAPMVFELEQATYLCGALAALVSRTGVIGMIGGIDLPSIRSTFDAFRMGAESVRPDIDVREVFIGNFNDLSSAREASFALATAGADFLIHQVNDAGRGVFQAAAELSQDANPIYVCGTNKDQSTIAPNVVIASATLDLPNAFLKVARSVAEGEFEGKPLNLGMREGIVEFVWNRNLTDRLPSSVHAALADIESGIRGGSVRVPRGALVTVP